MAAAALTYTITNGTAEDASQVQQNFTDLLNYINASTMRVDGTNAMTAALKTDNVDPTLNSHAVRKAYMDGAVVLATTANAQNFTSGVWKTVTFATETRDGDNGANTATNYNLATGLFTVPKTGLYLLTSMVFHSGMADSHLYNSRYSINAAVTVVTGPSCIPSQNPLVDPTASFTTLQYLTALDTVELQVMIGDTRTETVARRFGATWLHA